MSINTLTKLVFVGTAIVLLTISSLIIGFKDSNSQERISYCQKVGDDNCDGVIMSYETGWQCVSPSGGPLICEIGEM